MNKVEKKAYKKFTRMGFVVKGIIYTLSGVLAVIAAMGPGGETLGRIGILKWIDQIPFGSVLLVLMIIGSLGYTALRFMQAINDTNHKGFDWKAYLRRAGYLISGLIYLLFFFVGIYILFPKSDVVEKEEINYIHQILQLPAGNLAVAIAGIFTFGYGILEIVRGMKGSYKHHLSLQDLNGSIKKAFSLVGGIGYVARGIVLCTIGFITTKAAFNVYTQNSQYVDQYYTFLSSNLSSLFMGIVASGLFLYGLFMFFKAKFYNVSTS